MNDLDRYLIESVALKHDHGGLTPADDGLPAGLAAGNIIAHTGTGPVLGVIRAVSAECLLQRRGIVPTSKTDWTVGADCWVDDATGAWTETAQPDPDLWVGRAVTNDSIEVLRNDPNAEWPASTRFEYLTPDATAEVAQNAFREGAVVDLTDAYRAVVSVHWALTSATAHTGTRLLFQGRHAASGDEGWTTLFEPVVGVGTANLEPITNAPAAAGTTVFTVASTAGYTADGILRVFLEDVTTFANSEWMMAVAHDTDASVTMLDGSLREHAASSILYNVAGVVTFVPVGWSYLRVIVDNTYDSDGSTVATRTLVTKTVRI